MKTITKFELLTAFFTRNTKTMKDSRALAHCGVISSIQHEDGSGSSFIITLENGDKFHLRTID